MVLISQNGPETLPIGAPAPDFTDLPGTDGKTFSLDSFSEATALVISFTCNHCPYAQAYEDRFIALAREFMPRGIAFVAINPNDAKSYPDDSMEMMKQRAAEKQFPFPYLRDESQAVARAYGAVCTPHIFAFDRDRKLVYEGRIDDNWKDPEEVTATDLQNALESIVDGRAVPTPNTNPLGCSIKWISDR